MSKHFKKPFNPIPWHGSPHDFSSANGVHNRNLGIYATEDTQRYIVGTRLTTWDGRVFKYIYAEKACTSYHGAVTLATHAYAGEALVSSVVVGDTSVLVTQTGFTEDELQGGFICVYGAGSHAMNRLIVGNDATVGTTTMIYIDGPISVAGDTLYHEVFQNPYKRCSGTPQVYSCVVAVPAANIAVSSYGWGQTWGPCVVSPAEDVGTRSVSQDRMVFDTATGLLKANGAADTYRQNAGFILNQGVTTYGPLIMLQLSI